MPDVEVIQVVHTRLLRRGNGRDDPIRIIEQYWTLDGELLAEKDPLPPRAPCPCGDPTPPGCKPCTYEQPCVYARSGAAVTGEPYPRERWS
jgi:hypothetical protein